jgi:uncharacterized membrane protein
MSTLVAIAYPDLQTAEQVRQELIKLHQALHPAAKGAAGGAVWGGLIGLLFLAPFLGMAFGAAGGALGGKMADVGVADDFVKSLGERMPAGGAALIALGSTDARDKLLDRVGHFGGHVIQTSLSRQEEDHLRQALGEGAPAA